MAKRIRKRDMTIEQQLAYLNAPAKPARKLAPQRLFGCEIIEVGGGFEIRKNGAVVGHAGDRRAAQEVARANW